MLVELHDKFQRVARVQASRLVIYDCFDNPIAVAVELQPRHYTIATAADKTFPKVLEALGINRTVLVDAVDIEKG